MKYPKAKFAIVLVLMSALGCAIGGSGSGNPIMSTSEPPADPVSAMSVSASRNVLNNVCTVLVKCLAGLTTADCETGVKAAVNLEPSLGLVSGGYANFGAIITAEEAAKLTPNSIASGVCGTAIAALTCTDPNVLAARDADGGFSGVLAMMPSDEGSCKAIFK